MGYFDCPDVNRKINDMIKVLVDDTITLLHDASDSILEQLFLNPKNRFTVKSPDDIRTNEKKLTDRFIYEIEDRLDDGILDDINETIIKYIHKCRIPSWRKIGKIIESAIHLHAADKLSDAALIFATKVDLERTTSYGIYTKIPDFITEFAKNRSEAVERQTFLKGFPVIESMDLSSLGISDFCDLDKLEADEIYIDDNPIKKIRFKDKKQFLNILKKYDFRDSDLPRYLKRGLGECSDQIRMVSNLVYEKIFEGLHLADSYYELTDEDVNAYFKYTDVCEDIYNIVQNSNMCTKLNETVY